MLQPQLKYEEKSFWCVDELENLTLKIDIFSWRFVISACNANIFLFISSFHLRVKRIVIKFIRRFERNQTSKGA